MVAGAFPSEGGARLGRGGAALDTALDGALAEHLADTSFKAKLGDTTLVTTLGRAPAKTIAIVGLGSDDAGAAAVRRAAGVAGRRLAERSVIGSALHLDVADTSKDAAAAASVEGLLLGSYRFTTYKSDPHPRKIQEILLPEATTSSVERGLAFADATTLARDLANEPASTLNPESLATRAREVADVAGLECTVLDETELAAQGFGGLIAVGSGSARPPRLIRLHYKPDGASGKVVVIGKGITFDSGGLSLKDARGMETMKTDMSGGAAVIGAMSALGRIAPAVEVVAFIAASENMPGGNALRPGDVIEHYGGKTTEVLNTDAEGRLVLADTLAFASETSPDAIIDVATLTGSITIALGLKIAGLFTNDDGLGAEIMTAADAAGERFWRMPLPDDFKSELVSEVADQKNIGSRYGGSITAARYLQEFVGEGIPWAHLDIAGTARAESDYDETPKGGSGFATRTLINWIEGRAR
jgi:leucyl aminopeptidase